MQLQDYSTSSASIAIEQVIEAASQLKECVTDLYEAYGLMPAVIDKE